MGISGKSRNRHPGPYVPTTTTAATTIALDNIAAAGDLATALASSNAAVAITTNGAGNGVAGTVLDSNGTVLLGKSSTDFVTTALGATLTSKAQGNFHGAETGYLAWNGSGGSINLDGTPVSTDATARTSAGTFHVGTTSGTTAPLNGYITAIAVYPSAVTPPLVASAPLTGVFIGTVATLSSGTLQGAAPSTYVNGDSWDATEDASSNVWALCNDCGWGTFSNPGFDGNVILSESSFTIGTPGYINLGNQIGGPPGLTNAFNTNLGNFNTVHTSTENTWKSCGIIAVRTVQTQNLFAGLSFDAYATAAPWEQTTSAASIISAISTNAATSADWNGMPPTPPVLPVTSPTFNSEQFGSPCFVQYAPGYVNSGLATPNPDGSGSYLYAISNDGGWNTGSNIYLARIPLATILTSLSGSPAAASTASNWQFYVSTGCTAGNGLLSGCWTSTLASATPIFTLTNQVGRAHMTYLPATNRYVLQTWYYPTMVGTRHPGHKAEAAMASASGFEYVDCAKPWSCTGVVSTADWGGSSTGYYQPGILPPSLALDGGYTATSIFAGNFLNNLTFTSSATYTPNMAQTTFRY